MDASQSTQLARSKAGPFSLAWEHLDTLRADGLDDLLIQDWQEIETDTDRVVLEPDWERLRVLERQGYFLVLAARDVRRSIIGYNAFHVAPRIHARQSIQAVNDLIWALPEWRARVGLAMIREAEEKLRTIGVSRITYACKTHLGLILSHHGGRLGELLALRGYSHIESVYAKVLG